VNGQVAAAICGPDG